MQLVAFHFTLYLARMSTPVSTPELEYMTVGDVCDYLEDKGFPDHLLEIFRGRDYLKDPIVFLFFFRSRVGWASNQVWLRHISRIRVA